MGSIKETIESGCRNMPRTGIHMIVIKFISSVNREIILSYFICCIRKLGRELFIKHQCFIFAYVGKLKPLLLGVQYCFWTLCIVDRACFAFSI